MEPFRPLQTTPFVPLQPQSPNARQDANPIADDDIVGEITQHVAPSIEAIKNGQSTPETVFMQWYNKMNRQQKNCFKRAMNTGIVKNVLSKFGVSDANYQRVCDILKNQ